MLFALILILALAAGALLPWWGVAIVAFVAALLIGKQSGQAFWSGFGAVFIAWVALALFKTLPNDNLLATRVASLFHVRYWFMILFVTGFIGGLVGAMASLSGLLVRKVFATAN